MDSKLKKIIGAIIGCVAIGGGYILWQYKLSVPIDDNTLGKNIVKTSKVVQQQNDRAIKSVQGTVKSGSDIKILLRSRYPNSFGESSTVEWNDTLGLYEVVNGLQVLYVTNNGKNVISGHVYDLRTGLDYTDAKIAEVSKIDVRSLPLNKFIKVVNGDGSRVIYVFAYLDDQFKKYYNDTLANINNASIYILINKATENDSDDEYIKIYKEKLFKAIYCSDDSERELKNFLKPAKWNPLTNTIDNCNQKIKDDDVSGIFSKYRIVWSPSLFLANGNRYKALPDYQLNQILDKTFESSVKQVQSNGVSSDLGANQILQKNNTSSPKPTQKPTGMGSNT